MVKQDKDSSETSLGHIWSHSLTRLKGNCIWGDITALWNTLVHTWTRWKLCLPLLQIVWITHYCDQFPWCSDKRRLTIVASSQTSNFHKSFARPVEQDPLHFFFFQLWNAVTVVDGDKITHNSIQAKNILIHQQTTKIPFHRKCNITFRHSLYCNIYFQHSPPGGARWS